MREGRGRLELAPARGRCGCWMGAGRGGGGVRAEVEREARVWGGPMRPTEIDSQPALFQSRVWVYNLQLSHNMEIK